MKVKEKSMAIGKVRSQRSQKYKKCSPTPFQESIHTIVLIEYENPNISGHLVVGSGGSRRRSIAKAILDLRTLVKW
jgi:hypothetical protein